jgi:hypothetical protein
VAIDKSKWNLGVKVSQKVIDEIKKQGMTAALKNVKTSTNAEYVEGVRRLYTPGRVAAVKPNWRVSTEDKGNYQGSYQTGAQTSPATPPNSGLSGTVAAALKAPATGITPSKNPAVVKKAAQQAAASAAGRGGVSGVAKPKAPSTPSPTPSQVKVTAEAKKKQQTRAAASTGRGAIAAPKGVAKSKKDLDWFDPKRWS